MLRSSIGHMQNVSMVTVFRNIPLTPVSPLEICMSLASLSKDFSGNMKCWSMALPTTSVLPHLEPQQ